MPSLPVATAFREVRAAFNLRLAFRALFRFPFVALVAIVSLALGIGANTAVFALFNQWLLTPLPVREPDRLVNLSTPGPKQGPRRRVSRAARHAAGCVVGVERAVRSAGRRPHRGAIPRSPERNAYTQQRTADLIDRVEHELAALPGVTAVTAARMPLLSAAENWDSVDVEGFDGGPNADRDIRYDHVSVDHFRSLEVPLLAGREFTRADRLGAAKVAIVNEAFARKFKMGQDIVGKRLGKTSGAGLDTEIVGFVRDAQLINPKDAVPPMMFLPHRQDDRLRTMTFYVRTELPPDEATPAIRGVMSRRDASLPVERLRTVERQLRDETMALDRFVGLLTSAFAILATLLAAIGLYGVLAYTVAQRTREIGLRMALGATRVEVRMMVLKQVGLMTVIGATVGLAAALGAARAVRALLFGLTFDDPAVLASAVTMLASVSLAAGFLPADRAARIDPMRALRNE